MTFIKIFGLAAMLCFSAVACKNTPKTGDATDSKDAQKKELTELPNGLKASHILEKESPNAPVGSEQFSKAPAWHDIPVNEVAPPSSSRRTYMATGWWFPKMAFQASDTTVHKQYMGKFLKFREDQSFDLIQNAQVQESGHWNFDEQKKVLYLSCKNPYFNNTWNVMEKGFTLILIGQTKLNVSGIQIRLDNFKQKPF